MSFHMDKTEIEIAELEDIRLMKYYTLPDGARGLAVMYGRDGVINLCERDRYFDFLERRAAELYPEYSWAAADGHTRQLLESRANTPLHPQTEFFSGSEGSALPLGKEGFSQYLDMVKWLLADIYKGLEISAEFSGGISGYRNNYAAKCTVGGRERIIPLLFSPAKKGFVLKAGNLSAPCHCAEFEVSFLREGINISGKISADREMLREYIFDIPRKQLRSRAFEGGRAVFSRTEELASGGERERFSRLIKQLCKTDTDGFESVSLPWGGGAFFVENQSIRDCIIAVSDSCIRYYHQQLDRGRMTADSFCAVHVISGDCAYTRFLPAESFCSGIYRERFENKYFLSKL